MFRKEIFEDDRDRYHFAGLPAMMESYRVRTYTANALNQYTSIDNPAAVGLRGEAVSNATVTVNREPVEQDRPASDTWPWHFALEADNGSGPDFPFAEIVAVINPPGTNTPDIVSTSSGHLYAPPQNETLTYDDDGNLLSDGRWQYTWNGENRLIKAEEQVSPTNRQPYTVEYAYDHQGRMVWKQISTNAVVISSRTLLWDGYNIIRETITHQQPTTNHYVWGLDLSGTLQGVGGVGGLLAEIKDGEPYFAASDANGNVTEYLSADGAIAAHYEYSPFGEIVVQSGPLADSFTHRFSTKPWCEVTGLSEYAYRKYHASLGRWMNRDPIGEYHFFVDYVVRKPRNEQEVLEWTYFNAIAYRFVGNNIIDRMDMLGLYDVGKCQIVIFIGHNMKSAKQKWGWVPKTIITGECGAASAHTCWSDNISIQRNRIAPGSPGTISPSDGATEALAAFEAAKGWIPALCDAEEKPGKPCCCKTITISITCSFGLDILTKASLPAGLCGKSFQDDCPGR